MRKYTGDPEAIKTEMGVSLKERLVLMPVTPGDLPERPEDLVAINLPKSIRTVWFL